MRKLAAAGALALMLAGLAPASAWAQSVEELAQEYANMPEVQSMMDEMFSADAMTAQFSAGMPPGMGLSEDKAMRIGQLLSDQMQKLRPRLTELMIESSARSFSAEELQALIDFNRSEHGASVMRKMKSYFQDVMVELGPDMVAMQQEITPQMMEILQEGN